MLEGIKIRKLDNGFTIKYYLLAEAKPEAVKLGNSAPQPKLAGELYVENVEKLSAAVAALIARHVPVGGA